MDLDFVIRGGTVITAEGILQTDLGVKGEKITVLEKGLKAEQVYDAEGMLVIPGGVDPHVHFEMPTATSRTSDDWQGGSRAAVFGGTTTVIDFIEPEDDQTLLEALAGRRSQADGHSLVDYSLHMTLTSGDDETLSQVPKVVQAGVTSFKLYTTYPGFALGDQGLLSALQAIKGVDGTALVHCENDAIIQYSTDLLIDEGHLAPGYYPQSRPNLSEIEAIQRVILLARTTGTRLYLVHISTAGGAEAVERAQTSGQTLFGETCPQYLVLDQSQYQAADPTQVVKYICAPPLRSSHDQAVLWDKLSSGTLQTIGTDHCAFNLVGQKDLSLDSFLGVPGGLPGVEARLSLMYHFGVTKGRMTLAQWVSCCSAMPARIFGLYPRKGLLDVGSDADIVIFNPDREVVLTKQDPASPGYLHEQVDYTPYEGQKLLGWPEKVFLRGQLMIDQQQLIESSLPGKFLHRPYSK